MPTADLHAVHSSDDLWSGNRHPFTADRRNRPIRRPAKIFGHITSHDSHMTKFGAHTSDLRVGSRTWGLGNRETADVGGTSIRLIPLRRPPLLAEDIQHGLSGLSEN